LIWHVSPPSSPLLFFPSLTPSFLPSFFPPSLPPFLSSFSQDSSILSRFLCHWAWDLFQPHCSLKSKSQDNWGLCDSGMGKLSQTMLTRGERMERNWHLALNCKKVFNVNYSMTSAFQTVAVFHVSKSILNGRILVLTWLEKAEKSDFFLFIQWHYQSMCLGAYTGGALVWRLITVDELDVTWRILQSNQ
jgi:hypothetical protein